jgi:hypothetical protein
MPEVMKNKLEKILHGNGVKSDLEDLKQWGKVLNASRCGLGQTAGNPIISSLKNFRHLYEELIQKDKEFDMGFDLEASVQRSCKYVNRVPKFHHHEA